MIARFFRVELDLRALAALRISLGSLLLLDVLFRCRDLSAFYTDDGLLPRITLLQIPHPTYLNFLLTAETWLGATFWMSALAASSIGMILGWRTRWCTLAAWVLHVAVKARNPLILHAGDLELGLILWWAFFLPLGARYSLDARANPEWSRMPDSYSSVATTGYLLQLSLVYLIACLHKSDPVWWDTGLALYYCFSYDIFATPLAQTLSQNPLSLKYPTFAALALESAIPVMLWMPWRRSFFRVMGCAAIVILHLAIALTLNLGLMVAINIGVTIALWPGRLFTRLSGLFDRLPASWSRPGPCPGDQLSQVTKGFLAFVCVYVVYLNHAVYTETIVPKPLKYFGYFLRLQQEWKLFAPHPGTADGWFVIKGTCVDESEVNLLREGEKISFEKPASVASTFPNQRWRLWLLNLRERNDPLVNASYATWLAKQWNTTHRGPRAVKTVTIIFVAEPTPLPGQPLLAKPILHFRFECPEKLYRSPNEVYLPLDLPEENNFPPE